MANRKHSTNSAMPFNHPRRCSVLWLLVGLWLAGGSPWGLAFACGPEGDPDPGPWYFLQYHEVTEGSHPLCMIRWRLAARFSNQEPEEAMIRAAWSAYATDHTIDLDLADMLYSFSFAPLEAALAKTTGAKRDTLQAVLDYGRFVASVAPVTLRRGDRSWQYRAPEEKHQAAQPLKSQAESAFQSAKDPFLRERWAFQWLRLEALYGDGERVETLYTQVFETSKDPVLKAWAEGYRAKVWRDGGRRLDAAELYLRVWQAQPWTFHRMLSSLDLMYLKSEEWEALTKRMADPNTKAYACYVRALLRGREYSLDGLRDAAIAAPNSPAVQSLLELFIHNIEYYEQEHLVARFSGGLPVGTRFLALAEFVAQQARAGKVQDPGYWFLTAAYLYLLDGRHAQAAPLLAAFDARFAEQANLREQRLTLTVLHGFIAQPEQAAAPDAQTIIIQLARKTPSGESKTYNRWPVDAGRSLLALAAFRTAKKGDIPAAALLFKAAGEPELGDFLWNHFAAINDLPRWSTTGPLPAEPRSFNDYLRAFLPPAPSFIGVFHALLLIRDEAYEQAEKVLDQVLIEGNQAAVANGTEAVSLPRVQWSEADPLTRGAKTPLDEDADLLMWTRHILSVKKELAQATDAATRNALNRRLGHIFLTSVLQSDWPVPWFNPFPVNGKPYEQGRGHWPPYAYYARAGIQALFPTIPHLPTEIGNQRAAQYYQAVLAESTRAEDAAEACVLLQICAQKTLYKEVEPDAANHAFFYKLAREYGETQFYQRFRESCPTIEKFK